MFNSDHLSSKIYKTGTGQNLITHDELKCRGEFCSVHNPSNHSMKDFPTHWRSDRRIMERICPHGVGHPDPDDVAFYAKTHTEEQVHYYSVHGCDRCCNVEE